MKLIGLLNGRSLKKSPRNRIAHIVVLTLIILSLFLTCSVLNAAPFSSDISISGNIEFDEGFALADGQVTQKGSIFSITGGTETSSGYSGEMVSGINPVNGMLTDPGDGFGFTGITAADYYSEFGVGVDMEVGIINNSLTDTYQITFKVEYDNIVNSSGGDSYSDSEFFIEDDYNELFFTDILSDSLYGNEIGGEPTGESGGMLEDAGNSFFDIILEPSEGSFLYGSWTLEGGAFDDPGAANADMTVMVSIENVKNLSAVPLPGTLLLLGSGFLGVLTAGRRRMFKQ